jgi:hypothetical protein
VDRQERARVDIDTLVGSRQRSSFLTQAAEEKLMRLRLKALEEATGSWKDKDHPELKQAQPNGWPSFGGRMRDAFKKYLSDDMTTFLLDTSVIIDTINGNLCAVSTYRTAMRKHADRRTIN